MIAQILIGGALMLGQPAGQTDPWVLYVQADAGLRFGDWPCAAPGTASLLRGSRRRLAAVRHRLVSLDGETQAVAAEHSAEALFAEEWGSVAPTGCPRDDASWERQRLRELTMQHNQLLRPLERAVAARARGR